MTIGRPPKFRTKEEREAARREQVRNSVRSYRRRKLEKQREEQAQAALWRSEQGQDEQDADLRWIHDVTSAKMVNKSMFTPFDIGELSSRSQAELSFGFFPAIVQDFERATARFPWSSAQNKANHNDPFLNRAIFAGGARLLSGMYNHDGLTNLSRQAYQETLPLIRRRMEKFSREDVLPLIGAMTAIANFEIGEGATRNPGTTWAVHANAIIKLIRTVGPEVFQTSVGLNILRAQRYIAIVLAMWDESKNFFDKEEWQTIPYLIEGKTKEDRLWDFNFAFPNYHAAMKRLIGLIQNGADASTIREIAISFHQDVHKSQNELRRWRLEYETEYFSPTKPSFWYQPAASWFTEKMSPEARSVFSLSLHYPSLMQAEAYVTSLWTPQYFMLQWAKITHDVLLHNGFADCAELWAKDFFLGSYAPSCSSSASNSPSPQDSGIYLSSSEHERPEDCDPEYLVSNICRSMEYILGPDVRDVRGVIICGNVPFQLAREFYSNRPEIFAAEISWCEPVGEMLARRCLYHGKPQETLTGL